MALTALLLIACEDTGTYQLLAPGAARARLDAVLACPHLDLGTLCSKGWNVEKMS